MVLLHILTPYLLRRFFEWLEKTLRSPDSQEIPLETREFLLKSIPIAKTVVLYCHRLHMAVFYLQGLFYQIAKRISGVQYVSKVYQMIYCCCKNLFSWYLLASNSFSKNVRLKS